jgi:amino acid adenylation domain-containing protein
MNGITTITEEAQPRQSFVAGPLITELFSSQAKATPDAIALASATRVLSYHDLDERSSALAEVLRDLGVGSEVVVGLCAPRSPEMVVGALGILKAGGAYLPLDAKHPTARLGSVLDDAEVAIVVTCLRVKDKTALRTRQTIVLDELARVADSPPVSRTAGTCIAPTAKSLAYVIYTSGSTGRPKGVEITHESLLNLVRWHQRAFGVTAADRASQIANVGFDAAVWEIWPYLTAGASLHLPNGETVSDPQLLRDWLVAEKITVSFIPTPLAERLLTMRWPSGTALRTMLTGADTLHLYPPAGLPFLLVNNYGPTECTVVATSGAIDSHDSIDQLPPIGCAIDNTEVYILDESGRQVPPQTAGELHIGGKGVARGYRNRPELTAERFIPNPVSGKLSERLFKTGDRAQFLPDGRITFLGRMDEQVKVRGFRIELNEITAALNEHPGIRQSVVVAREVSPGDTRLIGYFVPMPVSEPKLGELREFLATRLPDYMIPATFVRLEKVPLTPNGKVDRMSLPVADGTNTLRDNAYAVPRTEMEKAVASILGSLLDLEHVDVEENFFSLGGHSLLGAQLIARLRDTFGIEMPLRVIFEAPSVAELASEVHRLLLAKLQAMSDKEVERLLESTPRPPLESSRGND